MKSEEQVRVAYEAFREKHKGNFLQAAEYEACLRVFEWVLDKEAQQ
jgi:hypothetical protein